MAPMSQTLTINGAVPIVPYSNPRSAIRWLEQTFGAVATAVHPPDPDQPLKHAEVKVGNGLVMINDADRGDDSPFALPGPVLLYVVVDDPDALHDRAAAAGAEIVMGLSRTRTTAHGNSPPAIRTATSGALGRTVQASAENLLSRRCPSGRATSAGKADRGLRPRPAGPRRMR